MRKLGGLITPQMAAPLVRPVSLGAFPLGRGNVHKRFRASASPLNLNASSDSSTVSTPWLTIAPESKRRGAIHEVSWRQLSGEPGQVVKDGPLSFRFSHALPWNATFAMSWRATIYNQFSEVAELDASFSLTRYEPIPPLQAFASPTTQTFAPVDPVTRQATVYFSVTVTSGVPPYSFNWNGGDNPLSSSNSATFTLPAGATQGFDFIASCWVSDAMDRTIGVQTAPFFIYDGPPMG